MTTAAPTFHRRPKAAGRVKPKTGRTAVNAVDLIAASAFVVRPVALAGAILAVAAALPAQARADVDPVSPVLNQIGIGNNGPLSTAIAQIGTSLCPLLVQPGSQLASNAVQASGNGGLAPPIAGWVAGVAIQTQCPAFMTRLANGDFTVLSNAATMLGMAPNTVAPAVPGLNPLLPPGM